MLTAATIVQAGAADLSWDWPPGCGQVVAKGGVGAEMMRMMVLLAEFSLLMQATWESELSIFMKQDRSIDSCHLISNDCLSCHDSFLLCNVRVNLLFLKKMRTQMLIRWVLSKIVMISHT